jgi:hypothetical protein
MSSNLLALALIIGALALLAFYAGPKPEVHCCENPAHKLANYYEIG